MIKLSRTSQLSFVPASHEDPNNPGVLKKVLLAKGDVTEGQLQMLNWALMPRGKEFQNHYHEDMDEVFVIIKGAVEMSVGKESVSMERGDAVVVPAGMHHQMKNITDDDVEYLVFGISKGKGGKTIVAS